MADRFHLRPGESVDDWFDRPSREDRQRFREFLIAEGRPDILAQYDEQMRLSDLGITGARMCWHSISLAQRWALTEAAKHGGRLERIGKEYRHRDRHQPYRPIYLRTVRNLCARELLAWDGGIPDPEAAAVVTERGLFVLKHGPIEDANAR